MQEHEEKRQLKEKLGAIAADVGAARNETAALRAWKKTAAEQALTYEAQVKHQGSHPQIVNSAILPLTVTQALSVKLHCLILPHLPGKEVSPMEGWKLW